VVVKRCEKITDKVAGLNLSSVEWKLYLQLQKMELEGTLNSYVDLLYNPRHG